VQLAAFQKLTLLDFPGTVACTVFTKGCNFRCPFCHNASLVVGQTENEPALTEETLLSFLESRTGILEGVAITGGEPLLQRDMPALLAKIKALGYKIKLDTNGSVPDMLEQLVSAGLVDYVAMDIKNAPEQYGKTIGKDAFDMTSVTRSKTFLMEGHVPFEFRTTVVRPLHDKESLTALAKWIAGDESYFLQGFSDSGQLLAAEGLSAYSEQEMQEFLQCIKTYVPNAQLRGI